MYSSVVLALAAESTNPTMLRTYHKSNEKERKVDETRTRIQKIPQTHIKEEMPCDETCPGRSQKVWLIE